MQTSPQPTTGTQWPLTPDNGNLQPASSVKNIRDRLSSVTGTRPVYDYELMLRYARIHVNTFYLPLILVLCFGIIALYLMPPAMAFYWMAISLTSQAATIIACKRLLNLPRKKFVAKAWNTKFIFLETLDGLAVVSFSAMAISLSYTSGFEQILFEMLIIIIALKALQTYTLPIALMAGTIPLLVITLIISISVNTSIGYIVSILTVIAFAYFIMLAFRLRDAELSNLENELEKDELIAGLELATNQSHNAQQAAENANLAKSKFLATMSHELRTPLNAILGFSEVMKSEVMGPMENKLYKEYAGDIHSSGSHLLRLINELLDLSRIEAGKFELNESAVNLSYIAEDCKHMLDLKANDKAIELRLICEDNLPKIWADEKAIRQIALNLLSNALKFTPSSGLIVIKVGWTAGKGQFLSVRDNGPGIPEDEIETVLSSFGQGSLAHKTAEAGAGLGLAICQNIMKLHNGNFYFNSQLGAGTEVTITFSADRIMIGNTAIMQQDEDFGKGFQIIADG